MALRRLKERPMTAVEVLRAIVADVVEDGLCTWCYKDHSDHDDECLIGKAVEAIEEAEDASV